MGEFKTKIKCQSCEGTGLYVGMAEGNGVAVVCYKCNGTGCQNYSFVYEPFVKRKIRKDIKRVFKKSCGYGHGSEDGVTPEGKKIKFSEGGVSYEEWLKGEKPKPVKDLYCPYLWTSQSMQDSDHSKYKMYKEHCNKHLNWGSITNCPMYNKKEKCWEIYGEDTE